MWVLTLTRTAIVSRALRIFSRSKDQWVLWLELQKAIDEAPSVTPCTNFPDLFFGDSAIGAAQADTRMARELCQQCPITNACLTYALEAKEEWGVWGGLSTQERKRLRKTHGSTRKTAKAI